MWARRLVHSLCLTAACFSAVALEPQEAAAQASTWLYIGGGAGVLDFTGGDERQTRAALHLDTGLGSAATHPLVVGALFRAQGYFGSGVDLALVARAVSRGFARGDWGIGLDVGAYQRWWGTNSTGGIGNLVLGGPWGLTLLAGATLDGGGDQRLYFASLGLDLARLTVHRHSGLDWFANPMRAPED